MKHAGLAARLFGFTARDIAKRGGWLIYHEGSPLGHTLTFHVNVDDAFLIGRFADARIRSATRFLDQATAERVISETIRQNRMEIGRWIRNEANAGQYLRLRWLNLSHVVIGRGLRRGDMVVCALSGDGRVILAPRGRWKYVILTAFPEL